MGKHPISLRNASGKRCLCRQEQLVLKAIQLGFSAKIYDDWDQTLQLNFTEFMSSVSQNRTTSAISLAPVAFGISFQLLTLGASYCILMMILTSCEGLPRVLEEKRQSFLLALSYVLMCM